MKMKNFIIVYILSIFLAVVGSASCKKFVELPPQTGTIAEDNVFTENTTAIAAVNGIYSLMASSTGPFTGPNGISFLAGLSADEFSLFNGLTGATADKFNAYYSNSLSSVNPPVTGSDTWAPIYDIIYECNSALKGLTHESAASLTPTVRSGLIGEVHFLRAFLYFYLVNLYGDVPLAVSTDPNQNTFLSRTPVTGVYNFIVQDLLVAKEQLPGNFPDITMTGTSIERIRATRWAASALLARVYLFTGQYSLAETASTEVISQNGLFSLLPLNDVFVKNSREAILQFQPTARFFNVRDGQLFNILSTGPSIGQPVSLSSQLRSAFEPGDNRYKPGNWVNEQVVGSQTYQYPFKYKLYLLDNNITSAQNMGEYLMVLRLAEQYLIRAEARIRQNKIAEGIADLNTLRNRARGALPGDLPPLSIGLTQEAAMDAVIHERQTELFSEWGHRWFDLKRTGRLNDIMNVVTPLKSQGFQQWQAYQALYPLPQADLEKAPNLTQNPGYN